MTIFTDIYNGIYGDIYNVKIATLHNFVLLPAGVTAEDCE